MRGMYILLVPSTKVMARDKEVNDIGSPAEIMNAYGGGKLRVSWTLRELLKL